MLQMHSEMKTSRIFPTNGNESETNPLQKCRYWHFNVNLMTLQVELQVEEKIKLI